MKVLHVITGLGTGGAEMMLYKLLKYMDASRLTHEVISLGDHGTLGDAIANLGVPVHALGMRPGWSMPLAARRLRQLGHALHPALIQGWMYHGNLAAQWMGACLQHRPPVLWNIRAARTDLARQKPLTAGVIWLGARLSDRPVHILNNSYTSAHDHEERLGYRADRRIVIPNGFETEVFRPSVASRRALRAELGLHEDAVLVGLIGRYHAVKDHANFLAASARLHEHHPDVHFVLAGHGVERANPAIGSLVEASGLSSHLHLLGLRRDTPELNAALDVACSSSFSESFPNVIGEAMACGVPCVVTDVGDSAHLIGPTGRVVPPRDADALAEALRSLVALEPSDRQALGHLARQRIVELFSMSAVAERYQALYEAVLGRSTTSPDLVRGR